MPNLASHSQTGAARSNANPRHGSCAASGLDSKPVANWSDTALLDHWRAGDQAAGRILFDRYFRKLYAFLWRRVGADADDLVQETMLACVEGQARILPGHFSGYLFSVARRRLADRLVAAQRDAPSQQPKDVPAADSVLTLREDHKTLLRALRKLTLDEQVTLELFYWEFMSIDALAKQLDVPVGTAKSRLRRARQRLLVAHTELSASTERAETTQTQLDDWARTIAEYVRQT